MVWALFAGIWIFLTNVVIGVSLALTIIGIPFALQHLKLGMVAFAPFGKRIRG
ncbi:YccF domain-containing protein [Corallococcus exiguus]|uniref:YccF domain-containing protein n=1 Tax=Corallococcus exiguus TaxID=83462 RepID=UPI002103840F|nr:YccF domain-containing protein [Corallococcus sp. AB032C]